LLVRVEQEVALRIPIHTLTSVVCFGRVSSSPPLMGLCAERGIALAFFSMNGRFLARIQGPVSGNVLLRREQCRRSEDESRAAEIAHSIVIAKVANCRTILLRAAREKADGATSADLDAAALRLSRLVEELQNPKTLDTVRGHEGDGARVYFEVFDHLITESKEEFFFPHAFPQAPA
jgi:CRISP-associated protein Cas1